MFLSRSGLLKCDTQSYVFSKRCCGRLLQILMTLLAFSAWAQGSQPQQMVWLTDAVNNQPVYKNSRPVDISGETMALMLPAFASYQIQTMVVNNQRAMEVLRLKPNVCAGNKIVTAKRLQLSYASKLPQVVFPGLRIFARAESAAAEVLVGLLDAQGRVSMRDVLLNASKLKFVVVGGRNYGSELDALIHAPQWKNRFWVRQADDMAAGVVDMVRSGRIDLMLEYPNVAAHYQAQQIIGTPDAHGTPTTSLVSFPVTESPAFLLGHILCSRTPQGQAMIQQFDQALVQVTQTKAYLDAHLHWFDPDYHDEFRKIYNQVYRTDF